jgi:hypothetical protein
VRPPGRVDRDRVFQQKRKVERQQKGRKIRWGEEQEKTDRRGSLGVVVVAMNREDRGSDVEVVVFVVDGWEAAICPGTRQSFRPSSARGCPKRRRKGYVGRERRT